MSTTEQSTDAASTETSTTQTRTTDRTQLALRYNEEEGTATVSSAPPDEMTVPATEWITVDESTLVDVREMQ